MTTVTFGGLTANVAIDKSATPRYSLGAFTSEHEEVSLFRGNGIAIQNNYGGKAVHTATIEITAATMTAADAIKQAWIALCLGEPETLTITHGGQLTRGDCVLMSAKAGPSHKLEDRSGSSQSVIYLDLEWWQTKG